MKTVALYDITDSGKRKSFIQSYGGDGTLDVCIEYPAVFESAKVLRDFIVDVADFFHIPAQWKSRLTLIADEMNNNAIEYGSLGYDTNTMSIMVEGGEKSRKLRLEVADTGRGKQAKTAAQMEEVREHRTNLGFDNHDSIRGRGLFLIITKLVDELYFRDSDTGGLIVGVKKKVEI